MTNINSFHKTLSAYLFWFVFCLTTHGQAETKYYHCIDSADVYINTNKEIAVFMNTTVRSVESRRYRMSKKINLTKIDSTLVEYLQNTYSHTLKNNQIN